MWQLQEFWDNSTIKVTFMQQSKAH